MSRVIEVKGLHIITNARDNLRGTNKTKFYFKDILVER